MICEGLPSVVDPLLPPLEPWRKGARMSWFAVPKSHWPIPPGPLTCAPCAIGYTPNEM